MAEPLHHLPARIALTLEQAGFVLESVQVALEASARGSPERATAQRARQALLGQLWPELGDMLDEDPEEES